MQRRSLPLHHITSLAMPPCLHQSVVVVVLNVIIVVPLSPTGGARLILPSYPTEQVGNDGTVLLRRWWDDDVSPSSSCPPLSLSLFLPKRLPSAVSSAWVNSAPPPRRQCCIRDHFARHHHPPLPPPRSTRDASSPPPLVPHTSAARPILVQAVCFLCIFPIVVVHGVFICHAIFVANA
jgi:hypothetical protein